MNICIYGASSNIIDPSFIKSGEEIGALIAQRGHTVVFGAGANGMMGAVARGADAENGEIIGISPSFFNVDGILYDRCTEMIYTETMSQRKQLLEDKADAFLVTPGGLGTFDEFFETITLKQLDCHRKPIAIFNINGYFDSLIKMLEVAANGKFMTRENMNLFFVSNNPQEILNYFEDYNANPTNIKNLKNI